MTIRQTFLYDQRDWLLVLSRILLTLLFVGGGWEKVTDFSGTVQYMTSVGAPLPPLAALIAIFMELLVGTAILLGFYTRPLVVLLGIYTVGTAVIGHRYWTMTGPEEMMNYINFYKNMSITGGCLALCIAGPGRFSVDRS